MRYLHLFSLALIGHLAFGQTSKLDSLYSDLEKHSQEDTTRSKILIGICYLESTAHPENSKTLAEELLMIAKKTNDSKSQSIAFRYLGEYYFYTGDNGQATKYSYEMLKASEKSSYQVGLGQSYMMLSRINAIEGGFEKSKSNSLKAVEVFQKANLKMYVGYAYNGLGVLHYNFLMYNEAYEYFMKAVGIWEGINHEDGLYSVYGNLADVFKVQKKYTKSIDFFEKSLALSKRADNRFQNASSYFGLGDLYMAMEEYGKVEFYLFQSVAMAKELKNKRLLEESYRLLANLEKKRNRFENALKYSELKSIYHDSIYTENKSKQIAEMETRYETEKKNQTIQLLERDKQIQHLWTNIFIAAFISLAILFTVVYLFQRFREHKNRRIFNLEIDGLVAQRNELSEKYKDALITGSGKNVESYDQHLLKKAIGIVEGNISDTLFGVEQMAHKIGMSRASLNRKLKAITGFPPSELIRNIRLRKAASLLRSQANTVTQISIAVGFEDQSYFSKSFKKQFGVPPSEYLQSTKSIEAS